MVITMDAPPTRNAIGVEMATEIDQEVNRLEASPDLSALVITGRDPSFCSGANVKRMDDSNRARRDEPSLLLSPWELLQQGWDELPPASDA